MLGFIKKLIGRGGYPTITSGEVPLVPSARRGQAVWRDWNPETAITEGLKASEVVYACNRCLADAISSIPLKVQSQLPDHTWRDEPDHPLATLLEYPTRDGEFSRQENMEAGSYDVHLAGNSLFHLNISASREPLEWYPLSPSRTAPVINPTGTRIAGYRYTMDGRTMDIPAQHVIHVRFCDPSNLFWGMSVLKACAKTVDSEVKAIEWNFESMDNRMVPPVAFVPEGPMTPEQHAMAKASVRDSLQGPSNAHQPMILSNKVTVHRLSFTAEEMDFLNSRKFNRETICLAHRTPEPILTFHQQGGALNSNIDPIYRFWWENTVLPILRSFEGAFNRRLIPLYQPGAYAVSPPTLRIVFDLSEVKALEKNLLDELKKAEILAKLGMPMHLINDYLNLGLPAYPGWDVPQHLSQPTPATDPAEPDATADAAEDAAGAKRLTAGQLAAMKTLHHMGYGANEINARLGLGLSDLPCDGQLDDY